MHRPTIRNIKSFLISRYAGTVNELEYYYVWKSVKLCGPIRYILYLPRLESITGLITMSMDQSMPFYEISHRKLMPSGSSCRCEAADVTSERGA